MNRLRKALATLAVAATALAVNASLVASPAAAVSSLGLPAAATGVAATKFDASRDFIVARTANDELWYNIWGSYYWTQVPGVKTRFTPAVTVYNDRVHVVVTGLDNRVFVGQMYRDSKEWTPFWEIPGGGQLKAGPAAVAGSDGSFTVFGPGFDDRIYYQQWEDTGWSPYGWQAIPGKVRSADQVSAVEFQKKIVVAHRGLDERVWTAESAVLLYDTPGNSGYWGADANVYDTPGGGYTRNAPALTLGENKDVLHIIVNGYNHDGFWYQSYRNSYLPYWQRFTSQFGYNTTNAPAVNGTGFNVYLANGSVRTKYIPGTCYIHPGPDDLCTGGTSSSVPSTTPPSPTTPTTPAPKANLRWTAAPKWNSETQRVEIPLKNDSAVNAGPFRVSIQFNNETYSEVPYETGLAAGATSTVWVSAQLPADDYTYNFVVDVYNTVPESNEDDNGYNGLVPVG